MNMSNARQYPIDLQRQVINEVKNHNRLLSDVAKQYGVSAKTVYQWVRSNDSRQTESKGAIVSEIAYLQQKIAQLSQQLQTMAS
ncbi:MULTISPECIES: transposase [unclassified Shewanella]|uniref:transposase n=1 Tax=unclassified Shewanella TaxID=196818 RepID=UPI000C32BCDA|nr:MULTISPECIES: transposase [unclassified Shewanella]MBB1360577.1 transposase [Shewanella sp. SR44-4]MBB1440405.1 transposase [Shewanella sp. SG41-4]MBO1898004.1 transposase [Shewanella sp. BF02_Schw]PKH34677.1 transposase [Shewanella sp. ALD9]QHS14860.1 transposase [Shewanella sp. Arc9-LZ]